MPIWHHSLRFVATKDETKKLIVVPCICHRINNSYKRAINNCKALSRKVKKIRMIGNILLQV